MEVLKLEPSSVICTNVVITPGSKYIIYVQVCIYIKNLVNQI